MSRINEGRVVSLRVGGVRERPRPEWDRGRSRTWATAYGKAEVAGPVHAGATGLAGDAVADTRVHGGTQMAILAYAAAHYPAWRTELGIAGFGPGAFGENLTLEGFDETNVCIGDVFELGDAELQISQPRGPCANISRFWNVPTLLKRVTETGWTGWYLRVLREGDIASGQVMTRRTQPHPGWTVARVLLARLSPAAHAADVHALAGLPALSPHWREIFAEKSARLG